MDDMTSPPQRSSLVAKAERLGDRLPPPLQRLFPRDLVILAGVGMLTILLDAVLIAFRNWTLVPMPIAVIAAYVLALYADRFPPKVRNVLTRELMGFAILGAFTFTIDIALLIMLRNLTPLPIPAAVSVAYILAFGFNYVLNRTVNFRSHAPVGPQSLSYALVIACDYGLTVGVTSGLTYLGLDFRLARLIAAASVAVFTYTMSRFWVFRDTLHPSSGADPTPRDTTEPDQPEEPAEPKVNHS